MDSRMFPIVQLMFIFFVLCNTTESPSSGITDFTPSSSSDNGTLVQFDSVFVISEAISSLMSSLRSQKICIVYDDAHEAIFRSLMSRSDQWVVVVWDMRSSAGSGGIMDVGGGHSGVNRSVVLPWRYIKYEMEAVIVLLEESMAKRIVKRASEQQLTLMHLNWVLTTGQPLSWQREITSGEKVILLGEPAREEVAVWTKALRNDMVTPYARWSLRRGQGQAQGHGFSRDISGIWELSLFENKHFTIVSNPLAVFHSYDAKHDNWTGICVEILNSIADTLNFTYTLVQPPDGMWGGPEANGSWNGMVGMVKRGEVDFAMGKFTVTHTRDQVIDYSSPFWHEAAQIVMRNPHTDDPLVFLRPFRTEVWLFIFCLMLFTTIAMSVIMYLERLVLGLYPVKRGDRRLPTGGVNLRTDRHRNPRVNRGGVRAENRREITEENYEVRGRTMISNKAQMNVKVVKNGGVSGSKVGGVARGGARGGVKGMPEIDSVSGPGDLATGGPNAITIIVASWWHILGAIFQQGAPIMPSMSATRFVLGFWWLLTIVITATYTGNLIAFLAVPISGIPISSLHDLSTQSTYKYGSLKGAALYTLFEKSSNGIYRDLWDRSIKEDDNNVASHREGIERVKYENYVYIGEQSGVAPLVFNDCSFVIAPEKFFHSSFGFVFPEKSPLIGPVNSVIENLVENGLIIRWKAQYYPRDVCTAIRDHSATIPDPARVKDIYGSFILLGVGLIVAAVLLFLELTKDKVDQLGVNFLRTHLKTYDIRTTDIVKSVANLNMGAIAMTNR